MVQLPPAADTTFCFPMEGQPDASESTFNHPLDETIEGECGLNVPFWRTSLGQFIAKYETTTTELEPYVISLLRKLLHNAPSNEELFYESIEHLRKREKNLRRRSISPHPNPSRTTPPGYRALSPPHINLLPK